MQTANDLRALLQRIDRRSYPAYKDTRGAYQFPGYVLSIDHVQGDPFAAPSRLSIRVGGKAGGLPPALYASRPQRIALQDALTRKFGHLAARASGQAKGSGHSGLISVSRCRAGGAGAHRLFPGPRRRGGAPAAGSWLSRQWAHHQRPGAGQAALRPAAPVRPGQPDLRRLEARSGCAPSPTWRRTRPISVRLCPSWACAPL